MDVSLRIALAIALVIFFACVLRMLKKRTLILKYTLLWLVAGVIMVIIAAFPETFEKLTRAIGIVQMSNGLFAVVIFAILMILISITAIVSQLNDKLRQLIQQCAMYERRIRELEEQLEKNRDE